MSHPLKNQRVVVRAPSSGVFIGSLVSEKPLGNGLARVVLRDSQRIWRWKGGALETFHLAATGPEDVDISPVVELAIISDGREVMAMSSVADSKFKSMKVWNG